MLVLVANEAEQRVEFGRLARVEAGGRLVEAEEHGIGAHGAGDLQPALGAIGQVPGRVVGAVDQADPLQPIGRLLHRLCSGRAVAGRPNKPPIVKLDAAISALCWATIRFSSTVMPPNRRMFWKVRATLAYLAISSSGMRSSRKS